jgi:hypothetical protein
LTCQILCPLGTVKSIFNLIFLESTEGEIELVLWRSAWGVKLLSAKDPVLRQHCASHPTHFSEFSAMLRYCLKLIRNYLEVPSSCSL